MTLFKYLLLVFILGTASHGSAAEIFDRGIAVNRYDIANFSNYVVRSKLRRLEANEKLALEDGDFIIRNRRLGHKVSQGSRRARNWQKTIFTNFAIEAVRSHSVNAPNAHWKGFYINGSMSDWDFRGAFLEHGWFNGRLNNVSFRNAHLKDISFYGSKLSFSLNPIKFHRKVSFDGATLENVYFQGCDLRHATFRKAKFNANTKFENTNVLFATQFVGAKVIDENYKEHEITEEQAKKLYKKHATIDGEMTISGEEILKAMQ